jgi:hypothetical protein
METRKLTNEQVKELKKIYGSIWKGRVPIGVLLNAKNISREQVRALLLVKKIEQTIEDLDVFLLKYKNVYGLGTPFDELQRLCETSDNGFQVNFESFNLTEKA